MNRYVAFCAISVLAACTMAPPQQKSTIAVDRYDGSPCWPNDQPDAGRPLEPGESQLLHLCGSNPRQQAIMDAEYHKGMAESAAYTRQWQAQHPDARSYVGISTSGRPLDCVGWTEGGVWQSSCMSHPGAWPGVR
jgi:hypothetical protein